MDEKTVFRVSGALLADDKLPLQFERKAFPKRKIFKLFAQRTSDEVRAVTAVHGTDIVVIKINGGPLLVLHPAHARDLFNSTDIRPRGSAGDVAVTSVLPWTVARPGRLYGAKLTPADATADWFAVVQCGGDIATAALPVDDFAKPALYTVVLPGPEGRAPTRPTLSPYTQREAKALLVFVHGSFAGSRETFGAMWEPGEHLESDPAELFRQYEGNVVAFEHPALTQGPIQNALALALALPAGATLDLVTHGAGGLIAEVLLRAGREDDRDKAEAYFGQTADLECLKALRELLRERYIKVRRVVRVACPIRGTLLTGHRLDAYLSAGFWLARVSGLACPDTEEKPVPWCRLVAAVACRKSAPSTLPGLAAMLPDSALIGWLNAPLANVDSELYVVAGDSEGDSLLAWLQTLVSDALLWTDNDLLVQTRAMYGGVPRRAGPAGPKTLLLRDDRITHFTYFERRHVVAAIHVALRGRRDADAPVAPGHEWTPIRPDTTEPRAGGPARAVAATAQVDGRKPCLLLVPNIFLSVLVDKAGTRFWLDESMSSGCGGLDTSAATGALEAEGLARPFYGELRAYFERTHHVIEFPYDWRADLRTTATRLAAEVDALLRHPRIGEQPVRILAHGMGGLLVRAWHAGHADSWQRFAARAGARLLLLGVPNAGSFLPLRLFAGDETFGTLFNATPSIAHESTLRKALADMPGVVQWQAGVSGPAAPLARSEQWRELEKVEFREQGVRDRWHGQPGTADTRAHLDNWGAPAAHLASAQEFWAALQRALPDLLNQADKIAVVAGTGFPTVCGVEKTEHDLFFLTTRDGDRQVTLDSAALTGMPLWLLAAPHDALTRTASAFSALADLLESGKTARLTSASGRGPCRGAPDDRQAVTRRLPSHGGRVFAEPAPSEPLNVAARAEDGVDGQLAVMVHHGDLRFVREPLLVGHYRSMILTGTEAAVDSLLGERMSAALRTGVYPDRVGSFQIFENGQHRNIGRRKQRYIPRPRAAVIVGLGEEGKLSAQELSYTLRIGVLAYAERFAEMAERQESFELAATLLGSGGSGVTVSAASIALLQGVLDANLRLREAGWPVVATLTIVELYLDRASEALRVLNMQAKTNSRLKVEKYLRLGDGGLRRPVDTSYRGAGYDFISAVKSVESTESHPVIAFSLDTRRARTEVRAQHSQGSLVRDLVCKSSNTTVWDRQIGRTLFNLLIPVEIEPYLTGSSDMVMELDVTTAALPWEMLDTDAPRAPALAADAQPWAIRCKVLRKLRTEGYRGQVIDAATEDKVLIIGDPLTPGSRYPALEAARVEASCIAAVARTSLRMLRDNVVELNKRPDATTIINALFAHRYRIVHIAGHGSEPDGFRGRGGVVLSGDNTFLGASEIKAMRVTPELVFLNCCHLAAVGGPPEYDRVNFAAGMARQLIDIGVRCVIVAGWAIEDQPARAFATTFYGEIFGGRRFIDAVGAARAAAYNDKPNCNTWAAYQCYGDPDWSWKPSAGPNLPTPEEEFEGIASPTSLILFLDALSTELLYTTRATHARNTARLQYLLKQSAQWTDRGDVAQAFAAAFAALSDRKSAIQWYARAADAKDGTGALTAVELHAEQLSLPGSDASDLLLAIDKFKAMIHSYGNSLRRLSMLGNAHRRLSMLQHGNADAADTAEAHLQEAQRCYATAAKCEPEAETRFYPLRAAVSCRAREKLVRALQASGSEPPASRGECMAGEAELLEREFAEVLLAIGRALRANPNFWPIVAQSELEMLKGVVKRNLAVRQQGIGASLRDLHKRINTRRFWVYVLDDARAVLEPYQALMRTDRPTEADAADALLRQLYGYTDESPAAGATT